MHIHFIAIGGAAMHSLAVALKQKGHVITGSDDEIFDPAKTQLSKAGLLPAESGWFPEKITLNLDAVILGMHALNDNPELQQALKSGIKVYSYPEFLYNQTLEKTRVVISGSHGKTTITSMVMHVLKRCGKKFDYMVGSRLAGFNNMVGLSDDTSIAVFEGDEYLSSCIDPRPKFHVYQPQLALISGIAWDHINVFPTWGNYIEQFRVFIENMPSGGCLVYCAEDTELKSITDEVNARITKLPYSIPAYTIEQGSTYIIHEGIRYPMKVFGRHNMQNIEGARLVCRQLGIDDRQFFEAIIHFTGAGKRLQLLGENDSTSVFLDFAHSPSKVEATVEAVKEQYAGRKVIACLELHTFSSLNKTFLSHYRNTLNHADEAIVFFNPQTILHKRLEMISAKEVQESFRKEGLAVFTEKNNLESFLFSQDFGNAVLLLMSSGNFSGIDFKELTNTILNKVK